jgi:hypothetical protein
MKLVVTRRPITPAGNAGTPVEVFLRDGKVIYTSPDETAWRAVAAVVRQSFQAGQGFPTYKKRDGAWERDPNGRLVFDRHVDLADDERTILSAIDENIRVGEAFDTELTD